MKKRLFALLLAAVMVFALVAACDTTETPATTPPPADTPDTPQTPDTPDAPTSSYGRDPYVAPAIETSLPRNETLFFGGLQWEPVAGWSPLHGGTQNFANDQSGGGSRTMVFETAYMYNGLTDTYHPLLADGPFEWNADKTVLTYKMKEAAYWSDGTKVTAHDAEYTFYSKQYTPGNNSGWLMYIESVTAQDDVTVEIKAATNASGQAIFPLMVETFVIQEYILQKAWLEDLLSRNDRDEAAISVDPGEDFVWSGPYTMYFNDETRNVLVRDDGYWGQHADMWGRLPAPKYLVASIYSDNGAILAALQAGDVDVSQSFIPNVHLLWEEQGLPISTFVDRPPYQLSANMPTAHFNLTKPILADNVELRQAIAWATDYDSIIANAMTNQSPTFTEVPRSLMNPTPGEQALFDHAAVAHLEFPGNEVDKANDLLDESGKFPKGDDGWRTYEGEKVSLVASCPVGWSDWEAALEIVAAAGEKIGIEITTNFVQEGEFYDNVTAGPPNPDSFDIFMMWSTSIEPTGAWNRVRWLIGSHNLDTWPHNWSGGNYSMYKNPRADEIINAIPLETNAATLKALYTEAVEIYLTDIPSFSLMYRPDKFHTVYEGVWTGFTDRDDGRNVPPFNCLSGYAIADLYNLTNVN